MQMIRLALATVAVGVSLSGAALAGDPNGNFMVRLQATGLITQDENKSLTSNGTSLKPANDAEVSDEFLPTATLTYFFNKNFAVELFCCFANADIDLKSPNAALDGNIANVWMFPPALTAQWHFNGMGAFKPYVGAGVQYIHFFSEDTGKNSITASSVELSDAFGPTLQAGFDFNLGGGWVLNADVKKSWLDTKGTWRNAAELGGTTVVGKVDLDPLIVSAGLGYRFNLEDLFGRRQAVPLK
jgi:outer membrane protein